MRGRRSVVLRVALLPFIILMASCGDQTGGNQPGTTGAQAELELAYGRAPVVDASVTYQPDVVIVGGGAAMVRRVSPDTLTWTIAGNAPHLREAAVEGKVLFLTSMAVGRVLAVAPQGSDLDVTLAPVQLTELIRDGTITFDQPLDPSAMVMQSYPGVPGALDERTPAPSPSGGPAVNTPGAAPAATVVTFPRVRLVAVGSLPPISYGRSNKIKIGKFEVELSRSGTAAAGSFKAKFTYKDASSITLGFTLTVGYKNLAVTGRLPIVRGVLQTAAASVSGITSIGSDVVSGSVSGLFGNIRPRIEVPLEMSEPLPAGPVPLVATIKFKAIIETAFSARNSTLDFSGVMGVTGVAGFHYTRGQGMKALLPAVHVVKELGKTIAGISLGVTGVVVAAQIRFQLGVGIPSAQAGPFVGDTVSFTVTRGSDAGIVKCWQASVDVFTHVGVSYTVEVPLATVLALVSKNRWKPAKLEADLVGLNVPVIPTLFTKGPKAIPACA